MTRQSNDSSETLGPLKTQRSAEELNGDVCLRLSLLLKACRAEATPEGWRKLAMYLISRLPEFKFKHTLGDESKMHLPLMRIECLIRTNYPVIEMALDEARRLKLSKSDTNALVKTKLAEAPELSVKRAVRIEVGVDGKGTEKEKWPAKESARYETLLREYRKQKDKDALFTSSIRRRAHNSLRAWCAIENAFSRLEIKEKLKDVAVNKDDLEPSYD